MSDSQETLAARRCTMLVSVHSLPSEEQVSDARPLAIGDFEIDLGARLLTRRGEHLRLSPRRSRYSRPLCARDAGALQGGTPGADLAGHLRGRGQPRQSGERGPPRSGRRSRAAAPASHRVRLWVRVARAVRRAVTAAARSGGVYWLFLGRTPFVLPAVSTSWAAARSPSCTALRVRVSPSRATRSRPPRGTDRPRQPERHLRVWLPHRAARDPSSPRRDPHRPLLPHAGPAGPGAPTTRPGHEFAPIPTDT